VGRALLPIGPVAVRRGIDVLARLDLIRVSDRILADAATLMPAHLRSLDAIHLATIRQLGASITRVVTYDERMGKAVGAVGLTVVAPS
jgi:predicted nucleic acid-binding protein